MIGFAPSCFPLFKATIELVILLLLVLPVRLCLSGKCVGAQGKRGGAKEQVCSFSSGVTGCLYNEWAGSDKVCEAVSKVVCRVGSAV